MTSTAPHQAIYRRWRAQTFGQIVGQEAVVETLRNAVRTDRVGHAILFVGPRGTGKTSLARILAKAVNCTDLQDGDACDRCDACVAIRDATTLDVIEIDAASNRGINEVRDLRERLAYPPGHLRRKVYILDEAHQITKDAWNALLKSLEEPPPFVLFLFASTEPSSFPAAILSRLQRYDVRRLTIPEIEGKLARILEADGRTVEPEALALIARLAAGGMRDAESILDQLLASTTGTVSEPEVRELLGLADATAVDGFVEALLTGDAGAGIAILDRLDERGRDPKALLDQAVERIRTRLVAGDPASADLVEVARRLVAIDPERAGNAGLRLQLELALFTAATTTTLPFRPIERPEPTPRRVAPPTPVDGPVAPEPALTPDPVAMPEPEPPTVAASAPDPTPAVEPPVVAAGPPPDGDLARLVGEWDGIVAAVSPVTRAVLTECRPIAIEGNIVTLGFPEAKGFLKDHAERRKDDVERVIGQRLGRDVSVRTVASNIEATPPAGTPDDLVAEARRIFADELMDIGEVS